MFVGLKKIYKIVKKIGKNLTLIVNIKNKFNKCVSYGGMQSEPAMKNEMNRDNPIQYLNTVQVWSSVKSHWAGQCMRGEWLLWTFKQRTTPWFLGLCTVENAPVTSFEIYLKGVKVFKLLTSENLCFAFFFYMLHKNCDSSRIILLNSVSSGWFT